MKLKLLQKCAILYLVSFASLVWGLAISHYHVFPYAILKNVKDYVEGHDLEYTSLFDKLLNDGGIEPRRFMWTYPQKATERAKPVDVPGLKERREAPLVFIDSEHREGYRAVFGALDFEDYFWGGLLLDGDGKVVHTWKLTTRHLPTSRVRDELTNMYGLHLFPDGSVIFTQQENGGGIVKVDAASKVIWNLEGLFHHTIAPTDDGYFWTYRGYQEMFDHKLAKISTKTGDIETMINMADVRAANPYVHIFNLQSDPTIHDISHGNDVDPLSAEVASKFEGFEPGDLLLSYRTQNLLFVLDPDSLEIKWWRIGPWDRQHDPDWEDDGTIVVFSNNDITTRNFSDIVAIDPSSFSHETLVDGKKLGFFSKINGIHARSSFDTRVITSSTQGWVFEVDDQNKIVFSFLNLYRQEDTRSLQVASAVRLSDEYFTEEFLETISN